MKYGVMVLTHNSSPYNEFDSFKRKMYASMPDVSSLFVYNGIGPDEYGPMPGDFNFISKEKPNVHGVPVMFDKFIAAMIGELSPSGWRGCDYIVRTNSSTFINFKLLEKHLKSLPRTGCYAGSIIKHDQVISGTCIILSPDLYHRLCLNKTPRDLVDRYCDDVVIGTIMKQWGVPMQDITMHLITNGEIPSFNEAKDIFANYPLIRIRNQFENRRFEDIEVWNQLYRYYQP